MQDSQQLINSIHKWDKVYRLFLIFSVLMTTVVAIILLSQVYAVNDRLNRAVVENRKVNTDNNTYLRLNACIVSVPPQRRTPEYVKTCYNDADKYNDTTITRYGDGN